MQQEPNNTLISFIIPCYNEANRYTNIFTAFNDFQSKAKFNYEVIIVDDGSKDNTVKLIEEDKSYAKGNFRLIKLEKNVGKANALKAGINEALGKYICTLDADMSAKPHTILEWAQLDKSIFEKEEIYIATRRHKDTKEEALGNRKFFGKLYGRAVQLFTPLNILDTQCGFKLYPATIAKKLFNQLSTSGWAHDVDVLYNAHNNNITINQMPLTWKNVEGSKVNLYADGVKMFFQVLLISIKRGFQNIFILPFSKYNTTQDSSLLARPLFNLIGWVLAFAMPLMSRRFGVTGDEHVHRKYGRQIYDYFFNGDETASIMDEKTTIQLYGGLYDFISTCLAHLFPSIPPYQVSHYLNSFIAAIGIVFVGKIIHHFTKNYWWSILAIIVLVFSPSFFGQAFNNPKDIPFAAFYTIAVFYILKTLQEFPDFKFPTLVKLSLALGLGMGVRIGGLLLICYLGLFIFIKWILAKPKPALGKIVFRLGTVVVFAYIIGIMFWPWAHQSIIGNPIEALTSFSNYTAVGIGMLFKGQTISSAETPSEYLIHYLTRTAPIIVLIGFAIFFITLFLKKVHEDKISISLLPFVVLFPVCYAVYKNSQLYDGWRHFLFVYPPIVIMCILGFWALYKLKPSIMKFVVPLIVLAGMAMPMKFTFANHPFESTYFNELAGGTKGAYGNYEMDYYQNSSKYLWDWLMENKKSEIDNAKDTIVIATNMPNPIYEYFEGNKRKLKVVYSRYYQKNQTNWDYAIYYARFLTKDQLINGYFPSAKLIKGANSDGVVVAAVLKNEPEKYAFKGLEFQKLGKIDSALMFLTKAYNIDNKDQEVLTALAETYIQMNKPDSAAIYLQKTLAIDNKDVRTLMSAGDIYIKAGRINEAQKLFMDMIARNDKTTGYGYLGLAQIQVQQGLLDQALQNANTAISIDQQLTPNAYQLMAFIYQQKGDMQTAQKLMQALQGGR